MGVYKTNITSDTNYEFRLPETTLRFDHLLEELTDSPKTIRVNVTVYYGRIIPVKNSKR